MSEPVFDPYSYTPPSSLPSGLPDPESIWTVARLTTEIREMFAAVFPPLWIAGEISNFSRSGPGHCYFNLKDETAQVRAVMWGTDARKLRFKPTDGLEVLAFGSLDVYLARGQYQIVVKQLIPKGIGPLELAFRQLRDKLESEGLFSPARKRPIPRIPKRIALVTSPQGAAIRDFLEVALRRWQRTDIIVIPTSVQGERSVPELTAALRKAGQLPVDLIALVRGGGSLEDLWSFNDEKVVRAIAASPHPVVCGVGHEVDVTIADLVADMRALTPSEAAERIFPDGVAMRSAIEGAAHRLVQRLLEQIRSYRQLLMQLGRSRMLQDPAALIRPFHQQLDELERRLISGSQRRLVDRQHQLELLLHRLEGSSPLRALERGYLLATRESTGLPITSVKELTAGEHLELRALDGRARCQIEEVQLDQPQTGN